ncbi:DNA polymerase III subunit beta [Sphingobacterium alkalisoli]|uniref:Beta sliding clamp n=1 Tax=Sphingobacterium alkalisoli TaxID=1874115 RepID=A0A4U0GXE9_9SPHI|nr:DNA polymerase III subunit beta [Sphingobacterium alkalisoli]TJY63803.1 DNA polymerase III subunit beta [Sphingobacterium alkalisoli]GGH24784.1 DNA polymerase III subunit beta [Sphingobacterium alkalisoli]
MKFQANTKILSNALQVATAIVASNPVLPIYKDVVFSLNGNVLSFTSSDMLNILITDTEVEGVADGRVSFDGKLLLNILKTIYEETVNIELVGKSIILSVQMGKYEFPISEVNDFPKLPEITDPVKLEIPTDILMEGIIKTFYSIDSDSIGAIANLLLKIEGNELNLISTRGSVLSEFIIPFESSQDKQMLINRRSAAVIKSMLTKGELMISSNDSYALFEFDNIKLYSRLSEGIFPDYKRIIPSPSGNNFIVGRSTILSALKRLIMVGDAAINLVKLTFKDSGVNIETQDTNYNRSAQEFIEGEYVGEEVAIGLNGKFLVEILSVIDSDQVNIEVTSPVRPALLRPQDVDEYRYMVLIAPLML